MTTDWMRLDHVEDISSPALLVYPERIRSNLQRMIALVGDPTRLRPHVKTHKTAQIVALQVEQGITRCKCATIAEAEMSASAGATDVLLATQPVGPNVRRLFALLAAFPGVRFSTIVDDAETARALGAAATAAGTSLDVLIDLDVGQHRTGVPPGPGALELCGTVTTLPGIAFAGLHAYDGHIRDPDPAGRAAAVDAIHHRIDAMRQALDAEGIPPGAVVAGGTPTFPMHARRPGVECTPGTCVLWDAGYSAGFPDLDFLHAAVLLGRVISRPTPDRICLDLGHKAVASEMPQPRLYLPDLPEAVAVLHSEEHLVVETPRAAHWPVGTAVYAIPRHICPTVALHQSLCVVEDRQLVGEWPVVARQRKLSV